MSRKLGLVLGVVVATVAALVVMLRGEGGPAAQAEEQAAPDRRALAAEAVRARTEARARGEVDVSPCSAAGRVVEAGSGRGIEGALVLLRPKGLARPVGPGESGAPITARTDASGDWEVPLLPPGRYILSASAPGYLPAVRNDLSLKAGSPNPGLDLALAPGGHALRGSVHDIVGGPIEGAVISVDAEGEGNLIQFSRSSFPAVSDAEGRFEVQVTDGMYTVSAWHGDYTGDSEFVDVAGGPRSVELRLVPAATIEGTVRSVPGDRPVEGAIVSAGGLFQGTGMAFTTSGPDGEFSLWVAPGTPQVFARAEGYAPGSDRGAAPGHAFELYLTPEAVLVGKVVRAGDGSPVEGARVTAHRGDAMFGGGNTAITDASGQFRISQLSPGAYKPGVEGDDVFGMGAEQVVLGLGETSAPIVIEAHAHRPQRPGDRPQPLVRLRRRARPRDRRARPPRPPRGARRPPRPAAPQGRRLGPRLRPPLDLRPPWLRGLPRRRRPSLLPPQRRARRRPPLQPRLQHRQGPRSRRPLPAQGRHRPDLLPDRQRRPALHHLRRQRPRARAQPQLPRARRDGARDRLDPPRDRAVRPGVRHSPVGVDDHRGPARP